MWNTLIQVFNLCSSDFKTLCLLFDNKPMKRMDLFHKMWLMSGTLCHVNHSWPVAIFQLGFQFKSYCLFDAFCSLALGPKIFSSIIRLHFIAKKKVYASSFSASFSSLHKNAFIFFRQNKSERGTMMLKIVATSVEKQQNVTQQKLK